MLKESCVVQRESLNRLSAGWLLVVIGAGRAHTQTTAQSLAFCHYYITAHKKTKPGVQRNPPFCLFACDRETSIEPQGKAQAEKLT